MGKTGQFAEKQTAVQSTGFEKFKTVMSKINSVINLIGVWLFRLRKFIMAAPVVYAAIRLASYNGQHLPEQVGLDLQSTGEFAMTVSRQLAVMGPLGLTVWLCCGIPFGIRRMFVWLVPHGYDIAETVGIVALNFILGGLIGGVILIWRLLVAAWYIPLTVYRLVTIGKGGMAETHIEE